MLTSRKLGNRRSVGQEIHGKCQPRVQYSRQPMNGSHELASTRVPLEPRRPIRCLL